MFRPILLNEPPKTSKTELGKLSDKKPSIPTQKISDSIEDPTAAPNVSELLSDGYKVCKEGLKLPYKIVLKSICWIGNLGHIFFEKLTYALGKTKESIQGIFKSVVGIFKNSDQKTETKQE